MPYLLEIEPHRHCNNLFDHTIGTTRLTVDHDGGLHLSYGPDYHPIMITARSVREYQWFGVIPANAIAFIQEHALQVAEVGAGPSEFIQKVAQETNSIPMSIDPFAEVDTDQLLASAYPQVPPITQKNIQILRGRISFLTTSNRIRRIHMPIETAYETLRQELAGFADVVLDYNGGTMYGGPGIRRLEKSWLLKPTRNPDFFYWHGGRFNLGEELTIK